MNSLSMNPFNSSVFGYYGYIDSHKNERDNIDVDKELNHNNDLNKKELNHKDEKKKYDERKTYLRTRIRYGAIPQSFLTPEENNWFYERFKKRFGHNNINDEIFIVRTNNTDKPNSMRILQRLDCNKINNAKFIANTLTPSDVRKYNPLSSKNEVVGYKTIPLQIFSSQNNKMNYINRLNMRKMILSSNIARLNIDDKIIKKHKYLDALLLSRKCCKKKRNDWMNLISFDSSKIIENIVKNKEKKKQEQREEEIKTCEKEINRNNNKKMIKKMQKIREKKMNIIDTNKLLKLFENNMNNVIDKNDEMN